MMNTQEKSSSLSNIGKKDMFVNRNVKVTRV